MKADLKQRDQCTAETRSDSDGQQRAELLSAGAAEQAGAGGGEGIPAPPPTHTPHTHTPQPLKSNLLLSSTSGFCQGQKPRPGAH